MRILVLGTIALALLGQPTRPAVNFQCVPEDLDAAGLTCTPAHPCAVYLELSAIEALASRVFVTGNLHTADVTLASILLSTDDGGRTWTEPFKRITGAGLEQMQFADFENGWVSGQVLQGRPRDAFLLVTRNGGKTWTQRPIYDESRTGIIQQFWFTSKTSGSLLIDRLQPTESGARYELYESQTGGDSWMVKEVSARPLAIKRSRAGEPNPDWRLRTDGATKSYYVEQKQPDGKWKPLSIFPIHLTDCQVLEMKLNEPEPEPEPPDSPRPAPPKPSLRKKK